MTGTDLYSGQWNLKSLGQETNQRLIGFTVFGNRRQANLQCIAMRSHVGGLLGARLHMDIQKAHVRFQSRSPRRLEQTAPRQVFKCFF